MKCPHDTTAIQSVKWNDQTKTTKIKIVCVDCGAKGKRIIKHQTGFTQEFWSSQDAD